MNGETPSHAPRVHGKMGIIAEDDNFSHPFAKPIPSPFLLSFSDPFFPRLA